jgi:hypothetical protein
LTITHNHMSTPCWYQEVSSRWFTLEQCALAAKAVSVQGAT